MTLAHRLALRMVPEPWAIGAAVAVGLSPPFLAYGTAVYPEATAGTILAGATLLALRIDARPTRREAFKDASLLARSRPLKRIWNPTPRAQNQSAYYDRQVMQASERASEDV